jgi:hypothetical protein
MSVQLIKKISVHEVKKTYVTATFVKEYAPKDAEYMGMVTREEYLKLLVKAKKKVASMSNLAMDQLIMKRFGGKRKRLDAYMAMQWYEAKVQTKDVGIWRGAGGLPIAWTEGSLASTARLVKKALGSKDKRIRMRARRALPGIMQHLEVIKNEKYLRPIVFTHDTGTRGRKHLPAYKLLGDIDDGCMRSVAMAVSGDKYIQVYFGIPKAPVHNMLKVSKKP